MPKRVLFLHPYPDGTAPSQRFRFEQYLDILKSEGAHITRQSFLTEGTWAILYKRGHYAQKVWGILWGFVRRLVMLLGAWRYDYVFIHREASPVGPPVFEWILAKILRRRIIFDFDDAIWLPNTSATNRVAAWAKFHSKTAWICGWAYKVSAGNDYLANYARQFCANTIVNPTTIDTEHWHNPKLYPEAKKINEHLTIGWTGSHSTLSYLNEMQPILEKLAQNYAFNFLVIADKKPDILLSNLAFLTWDKSTEILDLLKMDIGIMPLRDDPWAQGKCGFKALQYMALGIPALVSPIGVNTKIIDEGVNGYLCHTPDDWYKCLKKLLDQPARAREMAAAARQKIVQHYSILSNQSNFVLLFT